MLIVVGGSGRKAGKTSLVERLIASHRKANWTAIKISGHSHGAAGWDLSRETAASPDADTGRYLAAGASEAWWLRASRGRLPEAIPALKKLLAAAENVIIESNSVLDFIAPDLFFFVAGERWKQRARQWAGRPDAIVVKPADGLAPEWNERVLRGLARDREKHADGDSAYG